MAVNILKKILPVALLLLALYSCDKRPEYPVTPSIKLLEATYTELPSTEDSFHIKIHFEDGDGDLGLNQIDEPRTEYNYVYSRGDTEEVAITEPYDCATQLKASNGKTYRISRNPNFYNFFINIYVKDSKGNLVKKPVINCNEYNGRFSRFDPDKTYKGPLEGDIAYHLIEDIEGPATIVLEFAIQDRAMHRSNFVRSQEFKIK